jgi:hypothetical protein
MMRYAAGKCVPRARRVKMPYKLRHKVKPDAILCCLGKRRAPNYPQTTAIVSTFCICRRIAILNSPLADTAFSTDLYLFPFPTPPSEFSMQQSHLEYDSVALRTRLIQRHGTDLGEIVYNAELSRRRTQDARAAELSNELTTLHAEMSALRHAAGQRRAKSEGPLAAAYSAYLELCNTEAQAETAEQAQLAPMNARSIAVQQQMRDISLPRLSERELQNLAIYSSANSERLRSVDKKLPPLDAPPPTALGKINMGVGLQRPRT